MWMRQQRFSREAVAIILCLIVVVIFVLVVCIFWFCPGREVTTVFLVRHAEYNSDTGHLDPDGIQRADELAEVLSKVDVDAIYVTQFDRTQETAQPLASETNLQPVVYDDSDIDVLVNRVMQDHIGDEVVIVGHSNTVPTIIDKFVRVDTGYFIESNEFYKIFILTISESSEWWIVQAKYGVIP